MSARDVVASRGRLIIRVNRGSFTAQAWPRKRGKPKTARQQDWVNRFSYINCLSKTPDPYTHALMTHLSDGNGWYPRDLAVAAAAGNLYGVEGEIKVLTPTANVHRVGAAEALTSGVAKILTADTMDWDNAAFFTLSDPTKLTVKKPGLYLITATWVTNAVTGGYREIAILVNGVILETAPRVFPSAALGVGPTYTTFWYLHTGDYIQVTARANVSGVTALLNKLGVVGIVPETV